MTNVHDNPAKIVLEYLDGGRYWHKGSLINSRNPAQVCLLGAYSRCARLLSHHRQDVAEMILDVIHEQFPDRIPDGMRYVIGPFNDHPDTRWRDIEMVLEKAAQRWDENN